ncbi:hypothetical protein ACVI1J_009673 [Bradyrhizobium diazoefficiens]
MAETVGLAILTAAGVTDSIIGIGSASALSVAGFSISISTAATIVGTAAIVGTSIGLQYALSNPNVPKPEDGAQPLKQAIPPRIRGYGTNRLAGYYLLFIAASSGDSFDVLAFHSGRIEQAVRLFLHDDEVDTYNGLTDTTYDSVVPQFGTHYQNVAVQLFYGSETQNCSSDAINAGNTDGVWTNDFAAKGIAVLCMRCQKASDPEQFTKIYPQGLPLPSILAKCSPIWDPRDGSTSHAKTNPVLQLIDYLTRSDGGMGEEIDIILPPARLAEWMIEADLCDVDVGGRPRYASSGFYQYDNSPDNVINKILATCDGWLAEAGDGSLVLTIGVYREPTDPPLTSAHILGFTVRNGTSDETLVNQIDITFTNPEKHYVSDQVDAVRDEDSISITGVVRPKPLDLSWVQNADQAAILGRRALLRLNPKMAGAFVTTLYGMRYLGKRWIKVQFPEVRGLEDCVIEVQDGGEIDLLNGRVTFNWILVDPAALAALKPSAIIRESLASFDLLRREDFSSYIREDSL